MTDPGFKIEGEVLLQFLIEAVALSSLGGLIVITAVAPAGSAAAMGSC